MPNSFMHHVTINGTNFEIEDKQSRDDLKGIFESATKYDGSEFVWSQGTLKVADATTLSASNRIRSGYFINYSSLINAEEGFKYCLFCYDENDSYCGCFKDSNFIFSGNAWVSEATNLVHFPLTYKFRIVLAKDDDSDINADACGNFIFYKRTDSTLTLDGHPADSMVTGRRLTNIEGSLPHIKDKFSADYNLRLKTGVDTLVDDPSGTRIRIVYKIDGGFSFTAICALQKGLVISLYDTLSKALKMGGDYITSFTNNTYTTSEISGKSDVGGYLAFSICKNDSSVITDSERDGLFSALEIEVMSMLFKRNSLLNDTLLNDALNRSTDFLIKKELYVGNFIQGRATASGIADSSDPNTNYRVSSENILALPCGSKRKLFINVDNNYVVAIMTGIRSTNLNHNQFWFKGGAVVDIPEGDNYYRVVLTNYKTAYGSTGHKVNTITPDENFNLHILYDDIHETCIENDESEKILGSARLKFDSTNPNTIKAYPIISHTSDCHGDYTRTKNFIEFSDKVGVDAACITGDIVSYSPSDGISWLFDIVNNSNSNVAICTGNHDVNDEDYSDSVVYDYMFSSIAEKLGNSTEKTWYSKDLADKGIRIISVNLYQQGGTVRYNTHFTNEQLLFICQALQSTPEGYGVIILSHTPLNSSIVNNKDNSYPDFFQSVHKFSSSGNDVEGYPIYDIVDAFIGKKSISKTYQQTGSPSSVSVTADFSNVANGVEFIAHLTGHYHADTITYVPGTEYKQLMLNVTCTNAIYGGTAYPYLCDLSDQGRNNTDSTQDAFNIYVVDRDEKNVKVVRVGANKTYEMTDRKYMVIPYAD